MDMKMENITKFIEHIKDNTYTSNLYTYKLDDLRMFYTDKINNNLHHSNKLVDYILHHIDFIIVDKDYNLITWLDKNITIENTETFKTIVEWDKCEVYYNYIGIYSIFFIHNDIKYYATKYKIHHYESSICAQIAPTIYDNYTTPVHTVVISTRMKYFLVYDNNNALITNKVYTLSNELTPPLFYSCFDELEFEHLNQCKNMEQIKKLVHGGYIIKFNGTKYLLDNSVYRKLSGLLPPYTNINKMYLDLYKSDNLNFIINYISLYPSDIIKRINLSLKTLAKELLNIYHMTRKKAHPEIYDNLNDMYKKILYDLHTIFIKTRKVEIESNEDFIDKKSLTVDLVYKYLKKIDIDILESIYLQRNNLIKTTKEIFKNDNFKIFFEDCINTKTISYLLNK